VIDVDMPNDDPQHREADLRRQALDVKMHRAAEARAAAERLGMDT
jgi:hypothetical protein